MVNGIVVPPPAKIDLSRWIRHGDRITWGQANAEPLSLVGALIAQRHRIGSCNVFLGIHQSGLLQAEHADALTLLSYCGTGSNQQLVEAGVVDILPVHYSTLPTLIRQGGLRIDVVLLQVSPADEHGRHSLGLACEYLTAALQVARVVIAEVNDQVPWTYGETVIEASRIDVLVKSSYPPVSSPPAIVSDLQRRIASHAAQLIDDGSTLQCGIGAIPEAVLELLVDRRRLGVHSGTVGDGIAKLMAVGALSNECKGRDTGVGVAGVLMGTSALHRFAHRNRTLQLRATDYVHHRNVLASLNKFVAINSAIEVDLTGQVNAEVVKGRYVGAMGGAGDFLRGALQSRGGVPIIALPSMAAGASRIVANLSGPVSTPRCDAGYFVTEHGAADLRGLSIKDRVRRMLEIAHPDSREGLERDAHGIMRKPIKFAAM